MDLSFFTSNIFLAAVCLVAFLKSVWCIARKKKVANNAAYAAAIPVLFFALLLFKAGFLHFRIPVERFASYFPYAADVFVKDSCVLAEWEGDGINPAVNYTATSGPVFAPAIVGHLTATADKKIIAVNAVHTLDDLSSHEKKNFSRWEIIADGEKIDAEFYESDWDNFYSGDEAVKVLEKIAAASEVKIAAEFGGKTAESELTPGGICRIKELWNLWRGKFGEIPGA